MLYRNFIGTRFLVANDDFVGIVIVIEGVPDVVFFVDEDRCASFIELLDSIGLFGVSHTQFTLLSR